MYYSSASDANSIESSAPDRDSIEPGSPSSEVSEGCGMPDAAELDAVEAAVRVQLIDYIRGLEELKGSICAAQARAAAVFDESSRRSQARAGVKAVHLGRGVAAQIALARRESPHCGTRLLGLARILSTEMPHTLRALSRGVISEWRATILVRETACLTLADRQKVDELIAGDQEGLGQLGDRKLIAAIKSLSYGLDPLSVVNRAAKAASNRFVSCRPAPDTMAYVCALLPVAQGVGVMAALKRTADSARAAGDHRSKGQVMADTFVERLTGQARAEDLRVEVQLIMTDKTLLHGVLPQAGTCSGDPGSGEAGTCSGDAGSGEAGTCSVDPGSGDAGSAAADPGDPARISPDWQGRMPAEAFVPDGAEPAVLAGYGIVPAQWARDLIRSGRSKDMDTTTRSRRKTGEYQDRVRQADSSDTSSYANNDARSPGIREGRGHDTGEGRGHDTGEGRGHDTGEGRGQPRSGRREPRIEVWLRRLYTAPGSDRLTAMDSRARLVPDGLARLIAARDQVCRTPWCGAPIRHFDHIKPFREGGPTSAGNIQGLCEACNQAKEAPGWTAVCDGMPAARAEVTQRPERHTVATITPTGHIYRSTAPPLPGGR